MHYLLFVFNRISYSGRSPDEQRKGQDDGRDVGDQEQNRDEDKHHGNNGLADLLDGQSGDGAGNVNIYGHRRRGHAYGKTDGDQDTEMDEVAADLCTGCKACSALGCPAIEWAGDMARINPLLCDGCNQCPPLCKVKAIRERKP